MQHRELPDTYFNQVEAARYLNRSLRWFQIQLASATPPPGFKIGKSWSFRRSELDLWVERFRVGVNIRTKTSQGGEVSA